MTATIDTMLMIFVMNSVFISISSQQHSFISSSLAEVKQWTRAIGHSVVRSPAPVWIPETSITGKESWVRGGSVTLLRTEPQGHMNRIKTTTMFTRQAWLLSATRTSLSDEPVVKTLHVVDSRSPVASSRASASQTVMGLRQGRLANNAEALSTLIHIPDISTPGSKSTSSSYIQPNTVDHSRLRPLVKIDTSVSRVEVINGLRSISSSFPAPADDIARSSAHSTHWTRTVILEELMIGDVPLSHLPGSDELGEGSGDSVTDIHRSTKSAPRLWTSEEFLDFSETAPRCSRTDKLPSTANDKQPAKTFKPATILRSMDGMMTRTNGSSQDVSGPEDMWNYEFHVQPEEPGSGDSVLTEVFQQLTSDVSGLSLRPDFANTPNTPVSTGYINGTIVNADPTKTSALQVSPKPHSLVPSPKLLALGPEVAKAQETMAVEGSGDLKFDAEDLVMRSASSLETSKSSLDRPVPSKEVPPSNVGRRWLWPVAVTLPPLLLLFLAAAVYWRLRRGRRRRLDISSSSGDATSPWSRPAQPALHCSGHPAFDPDESLAPPPPTYRQHRDTVSTSASFVSLELEESSSSSRKTSGSELSAES